MSHDKIRAAARKRMAETGESYASARRAVIGDHRAAGGEIPDSDPEWFAISYRNAGMDRITLWMDTLLGGGPGRSGVEVDAEEIRVRMADLKLDVPRRSIRSVTHSQFRTRGTTGVHDRRGRWLVNGSPDGLVELAIEPPCYLARQFSTQFRRARVDTLILSLVDPDGFVAALRPERPV
jgi:hypothetical protein